MSDKEMSVVICIAMIIMGVLIAVGYELGTKDVQEEAVKHGYATWSPDSRGKTTFQWNQNAEKEN